MVGGKADSESDGRVSSALGRECPQRKLIGTEERHLERAIHSVIRRMLEGSEASKGAENFGSSSVWPARYLFSSEPLTIVTREKRSEAK